MTRPLPRPAAGSPCALLLVPLLVGSACGGGGGDSDAAPPDGAVRDARTDGGGEGGPPSDASPSDGTAAGDDGGPDGGSGCAAPFRPLLAFDFAEETPGAAFLNWRRSVVDETHALSHGRSVRVRTNPGEAPLPECSGGHFFAGRTRLPMNVPQGSTVWVRFYQYVPSTFSFGFKYTHSVDGDCEAASACGQQCDGSGNLKWLVLAPDTGTARIYLALRAVRRAVRPEEPRIRLISEAFRRPVDFAGVDVPRDRWFSLQYAVRISDGDDGFIRAWLDDEYLGEVRGPTTVEGASIREWGMGDYWNGVPWSDGMPGRTDFWIDEIVVATDAPGYDPPTGRDEGGRPFVPGCLRVADLPG